MDLFISITGSSLSKPSKTGIMRQPWPPQSKNGFSISRPEENPAKFLFLKPNTLSDVMITQISLKKVHFPGILSIPNHHNPNTSLRWSLRTPGQHRQIMVSQRKSRGNMHIPPPGVIRNSGLHFDQSFDLPVQRERRCAQLAKTVTSLEKQLVTDMIRRSKLEL